MLALFAFYLPLFVFPSCYNSPSWGCLGMDVMQTYEYPDVMNMTAVGFEPTQLALVELESTPLDHSGKLSLAPCNFVSSRSCRRG
jgi:hypothetical protein